MITQEYLKSIIHYDRDTGIFTRYPTASCHKLLVCNTKDTKGYCFIQIKRKNYRAHRLAWLYEFGYMPALEIDHINGVKEDNRIVNLRPCTAQQNAFNKPKSIRNTSGYTGVRFRNGKWIVQIRINGKHKHLGQYKTAEEASEIYNQYAMALHGDFYCRGR
jgi:hypothetical protein